MGNYSSGWVAGWRNSTVAHELEVLNRPEFPAAVCSYDTFDADTPGWAQTFRGIYPSRIRIFGSRATHAAGTRRGGNLRQIQNFGSAAAFTWSADRTAKRGIVHSMRTAISVALLMVAASGAFAQRRGAFVAGPPFAGRPVVPAVRGTPGAAPWNPGSATCCAGPWQRGRWPGGWQGQNNPAVIAVPVPVPVDSGPDPQSAEPQASDTPPPVLDVPPVPMAVSMSAPLPAAPVAPAAEHRNIQPPPWEPAHVLIALNDGWVYAAVAYWVESGTLHYITTAGDHNQVSLRLVDRATSARLNHVLQIEFILP